MSAYITLMTPMMDEECLVSAIADLGIAEAKIERSSMPVQLRGWQSGREAHIVLRKELTNDRYNDIGFLRTPIGFQAILSNDHARFGGDWLAKVHARYQQHVQLKQARLAEEERRRLEEERRLLVEAQRASIYEKAKKLGYQVKESRENETLRLVLIKRTY